MLLGQLNRQALLLFTQLHWGSPGAHAQWRGIRGKATQRPLTPMCLFSAHFLIPPRHPGCPQCSQMPLLREPGVGHKDTWARWAARGGLADL